VERDIVIDDKNRPPAPTQTSGNAYQVKDAEYLYEKLRAAETKLTFSLIGLGGDSDRAEKNPQYRKLKKERDDIHLQLHNLGNPETRVKSAKPQPAAEPLVEPPREEQPDGRDQAILAVIARGSEGLQYCRELDNAGVRPPKKGVWKTCPAGTYAAAYKLGEQWPHRIQDEKSKLKKRYPELAQLASE
jgi:hypothetical protein